MTPSMMSVRDDEMPNTNVGVGYVAPGYNNPEFITMQFYQEVIGNYNAHENGVSHINTADRQYNYMHREFADKPGINLQRT